MAREWRLLQLVSSLLAMGAGLGLSSGMTADTKVKTVDQYWTDTGIGPDIVKNALSDKFCRASQRSFLSCANAVLSVAGQMQLGVDFSGAVTTTASSSGAASERASLEPWKVFFRESPERAKSVSFKRIWGEIEARMPADRRAFFSAIAYNAHLSVYRDPHTYLIPVSYYKQVIASSNVAPLALGVVFARGEEGYFLRKVMPSSPAESVGLKRGDRVLAVDGEALAQVPQHRLSDLLRAKSDRPTRFEILREGRVLRVDVPRALTGVIPNVTWKGIEATGSRTKTIVLTVNKFAKATCDEVNGALKQASATQAELLLLDLRDNSGGHMSEAACVVGLFVGPGKLVYRTKYLHPGRPADFEYTTSERAWRGRVAVLVNSGSASAAEIVAGALRDHRRAFLVGERTFGKGSFQEGEEWTLNGNVAFFETKGFYFLPSGFAPQMRGLEPDLEVRDQTVAYGREEDQYAYPLRSPGPARSSKSVELAASCGEFKGEIEDEQLRMAAQALGCQSTALGDRRASN